MNNEKKYESENDEFKNNKIIFKSKLFEISEDQWNCLKSFLPKLKEEDEDIK